MSKRNELLNQHPGFDLSFRYGSNQKEVSFSPLRKIKAKLSHFYDILVLGGPGSINKKGQVGIIVDLYKIDIKEIALFDWFLNDGIENVTYNGCRLWLISECSYWYAIEYQEKYYAFDIREICTRIGIPEPQEEIGDKHKWLLYFIGRLEESEYFIDIEKSIKR